MNKSYLLKVAAGLMLAAGVAQASQTGVWTLAAGNWSTTVVPAALASNDIAILSGAPTASRLVTNDASITMSGMYVGVSGANNRIVTLNTNVNGNTITFTNFGGAAAFIIKTNNTSSAAVGVDIINPPIILGTDLVVSNNSGYGGLSIKGNITEVGGARAITIGTISNANLGVTLSGDNAFTGGLKINSGTVIAGSTKGLGGSGTGAVQLGDTSGSANTTLQLGTGTWTNALTVASGNSGTATLTNGTSVSVYLGTITLNKSLVVETAGTTGGMNISGNVSGAGGLAIRNNATTTGAITLSGSNSFSGGVTLNAGLLRLNSTNALGATAGTFTINGGTINNTSGATMTNANDNAIVIAGSFTNAVTDDFHLGNGAVTMNNPVTIGVTAANIFTLGGDISGTGANALDITKEGAGTLNLLSYAALVLRGGGQTVTVNGGALTDNNTISGDGLSLTKDGTGQLNLYGTNTYSGGLVIKRGSVTLGLTGTTAGGTTMAAGTADITLGDAAGGDAYLGLGSYTLTNNINLASGAAGALSMGASGGTRSPKFFGAINLNGNNLTLGGSSGKTSGDSLFSGGITGAGSLIISNVGTGNILLSTNAINNTGTITVYGSTLTTNWQTGLNIISANIGPNVTDFTLAGGAFVQLSGSNSYSGNTYITGTGYLSVGADTNLGAGANVQINQNCTLQINNTFATSKNINMYATAGASAGGNITVTNGKTLTVDGVFSNAATSPTFTGAGTLRLNNANNVWNVGGGVTNILLVNGLGTLQLGNAAALNGISLKYNGGTGFDNVSGSAMTPIGLKGLLMTSGPTFVGTDDMDMSGVEAGFVQTADSIRTITVSAKTLTLGGILSSGTFSNSAVAKVDGGLTKAGAGTLIINGASDYTKGTKITAGTLRLGVANALLSTGSNTINGATAVWDLGGFDTVTNGAVILGRGVISNGTVVASSYTLSNGTVYATLAGDVSVNKVGSSNVTLWAANTFSGNITNNAGTLAIGNDNALGTGRLLIAGSSALQSADTTSHTITNLVQFSTSGITLTNNGTANLSILNMMGSGLGTDGIYVENGRTLYVGNYNLSNDVTLGVSSALSKSGSGTLITTNAAAGTLMWGQRLNVLGGALAFVQQALTNQYGDLYIQNGASLGLNGSFNKNNGNLNWQSGGFFGWGTNSGFGGANNLQLSIRASQTDATRTNVIWGTMQMTAAGAAMVLGHPMANGTIELVNDLDLNGAMREVQVLRSTNAAATDVDAILSGILNDTAVGTGGGLLKSGAGTLLLNNANTYTGGTTITAGVVRIQNSSALGATAAGVTNYVRIGASLELDGSGGNLVLGSSPFRIDSAGGPTASGSSIHNIAGNNTIAGSITVIGAEAGRINADTNTLLTLNGTVQCVSGRSWLYLGGDGDIVVNGYAAANVNSSWYKDGMGTLTLNGSNELRRDFVVSNGTLRVGNDYALFASDLQPSASDSNRFVCAGATLDLNGHNVKFNPISWLDLQGSGVSGNGALVNNSATAASMSANITNSMAATYGGSGDITLSGQITGLALTKVGGGTLTLSGQSTYAGATTNRGGGRLVVGVDNALPTNTTLYADLGSTLDLAGHNQQVAGLDGYSGTINNSGAASTLTVKFNSGTQNFLGSVTGASTLTLTDGGTLKVNNGGTSFGLGTATVVSNGSTLFMNSTHLGVITAYANSTVGGSGAISTLIVTNGGLFAPGADLGLGTQTVHTLTLAADGLLAVGLANASNGLARVDTSFTSSNALLRLDLTGYQFIERGITYVVVDYTSASVTPIGTAESQYLTLHDFGTGALPDVKLTNNMVFAAIGGVEGTTNFFRINYDVLANGQGVGSMITLTSVPEPGTASLLGLVGVAWLVRRIRRRRNAQG